MREQRKEAVLALALRQTREMSDLMESGLGAAREKFKELFLWCPEYIENEAVAKEWKERGGKRGELPFFSEVMLYEVLGKDQARALLARLRELGEALGFSSMEMHRDFKEDEESSDYPTQDDLDAFECLLRDEAAYLFGRPGKTIPKLMRTLHLMREVLGTKKFGEDVEYVRIAPKDLRVGDKIAEDGRLIPVLGFFDEHQNPVDHPVPDEMSDLDRERNRKEPYYGAHVKTCEDDDFGWALRSEDRFLVQRKKSSNS